MTIHNETAKFERSRPMGTCGECKQFGRRPMNRVKSCKSRSENPPADSVGFRLVMRRLELNRTQAEVAGQVKIQPKSGPNKGKERFLSRNALSTYESGRQTPSLKLLRGLAAALSVSPGWLAFGEDSLRIALPLQRSDATEGRPKFGLSTVPTALSA